MPLLPFPSCVLEQVMGTVCPTGMPARVDRALQWHGWKVLLNLLCFIMRKCKKKKKKKMLLGVTVFIKPILVPKNVICLYEDKPDPLIKPVTSWCHQRQWQHFSTLQFQLPTYLRLLLLLLNSFAFFQFLFLLVPSLSHYLVFRNV